jgi:chromosomal replication initiator protein
MEFKQTNLRADRTFDNFMIGESNKYAYQAALHCVTQFGKNNNWLWLYSENGLGGTHLLNAIGNQLLEQQPNIRIKHIHTERFVTSYRQAISQTELTKFEESYRELDCLLLDDMQYLLCFGYEHTDIQSELNNILSTLILGGKLVVFTADRPINELPESNIKPLLNPCKQVTISQPEITLKKQFAKHFALHHGFELPDDTISFISQKKAGNIRVLANQVNSLCHEIENTEEALSLTFLKESYLRWYEKFYK